MPAGMPPPAATSFLQGMMGAAGSAMKKISQPLATDSASTDTPREITDGQKFYQEGLEDQKAFHPIWYRNVAMYLGHQWLDWNTSANWLQETAAPTWRVKMVENVVLPLVRAAISTELSSEPRFYGMPSTTDPQAKASAKIAGRILEGKYHEEDFVNLFERLRLWARMTGSAYMFSLWDPQADRVWTDDELDPNTGQPIVDPATGQPKQKEYATGDVTYSVDNSFEVILQRGAPEDFKLHRRVMRVKIMDVGDIEDNWGKKVSPETLTLDTMYQARIMSLVDASRTRTQTNEGQILKNSALVKHYFELPSKEFPNGREFIYANGVVLVDTADLDYFYCGKRALPVGKTDDIKAPGRCQGDSGINHIAPIQIQINKMSSMVIENGNQMARPKVLSPVGSLADDVFTDQPAEVVEYVPGPNGQKPEPYTPPEMPQYFLEKIEKLKMSAQDVYGVHDVTVGRLPRRATSGRAIDSLQSADDAPMGLAMRSCGSALSRVFSISLDQMQRKYDENRIVRMVGRDHEVEVIQFKGADLKGCDFVRVVFAPHMTRGQKISVASDLFDKKVINGKQLLEIMEMGDINSVYDQDAFADNYIQHENMELRKGVIVSVGPMDDDAAHIRGHLDDIQGPMNNATPDIQMNYKHHIDLHKQQQMLKLQPAPIPGAPPPGAGAPVPSAGLPPTPAPGVPA